VRRAARRVLPYVRRTPLVPSAHPGLWLKLENEQVSGAFKARGAASALTALTPAQRAAGVVTHSSGNHGRALGEVGAALGVAVTVVVPDTAMPHKVQAVRASGARVVVVPVADRAAAAADLVEAGMTLVPPFDHLDVMAGQGTAALEVLEQAEAAGLTVHRLWAPVGGGGLLSGTAVALAETSIEVVGVEPALAADFAASVAAGELVAWDVADTVRTVADGLRLPSVGRLPWEHLSRLGVGVVTVDDDEILRAARWLADQGVVAEPSGAVSVAGALAQMRESAGTVDVAIVSGGNVAPTGFDGTSSADRSRAG
jgi:threonine dehydratase